MNANPLRIGSPPEGSINHARVLLAQSLTSRATALARVGRYDEAETVLKGLTIGDPTSDTTFALLARIRAQQGRLEEAHSLWLEAIRVNPSENSYLGGLRRTEQRQRSNHSIRVAQLILVACVILLFATGATIGIIQFRARDSGRVASGAQPVHSPHTATNLVVDALMTSTPGVVQNKNGDGLLLHFDSGLFSRGIVFTPAAKTALTEVGRKLEPHWGALTFYIVGHTDDLPIVKRDRFRDNSSLAIARADAVVRHITGSTAIPASAWSIRYANLGAPPFRNDSMENRTRNRTVEIGILPRRQ